MSTSEDHEGLARELEREADRLQAQQERLADEIKDVRSDWEAKRQDEGVPGAPPPPPDDEAGRDPQVADEPETDSHRGSQSTER